MLTDLLRLILETGASTDAAGVVGGRGRGVWETGKLCEVEVSPNLLAGYAKDEAVHLVDEVDHH